MITVVGAGISGLVFADACLQESIPGADLEVWDSGESLIGTDAFPWGIAERAANGVFASLEFEQICTRIGVPLLQPRSSSKARFIWRNQQLRRWPLSTWQTLSLVASLAKNAMRLKPEKFESLKSWGDRIGGEAFIPWILEPGVQGVFASRAEDLSAQLVFQNTFGNRRSSRASRRTLAPAQGMGEFILALRSSLEDRGVVFHSKRLNQIELQDMKHPVVLALAPFEAVTLLDNSDPRQSILRSHERVGLGTATLCLSEDSKIPRGFGALFPAAEWPGGPLGVLFNSDIFDKRVADPSNRSETWIYPLRGSSAPTIEQVLQDRRKLFTSTPSQNKVVGFMSYAWPTALPSYSVNWERALDQLRGLPHNNRFLLGPSYGRIGLASVLRDSVDLARQLVNEKESR